MLIIIHFCYPEYCCTPRRGTVDQSRILSNYLNPCPSRPLHTREKKRILLGARLPIQAWCCRWLYSETSSLPLPPALRAFFLLLCRKAFLRGSGRHPESDRGAGLHRKARQRCQCEFFRFFSRGRGGAEDGRVSQGSSRAG